VSEELFYVSSAGWGIYRWRIFVSADVISRYE
jgi:hypothetical protein